MNHFLPRSFTVPLFLTLKRHVVSSNTALCHPRFRLPRLPSHSNPHPSIAECGGVTSMPIVQRCCCWQENHPNTAYSSYTHINHPDLTQSPSASFSLAPQRRKSASHFHRGFMFLTMARKPRSSFIKKMVD